MNLVGKILTLLIFVMSIVFMTMAVMVYQTHANWRADVLREKAEAGKPKGWKPRLEESQTKNLALTSQLDDIQKRLDAEKIARKTAVDSVTDQLKLKEDECKLLVQTNRTLEKDNADKFAAIEKFNVSLKDAIEQRDIYKNDIKTARDARDASFERAKELADQVHQLTNQVKQLQARHEDLVLDYQRARDILRLNDINPDANPKTIQPNVKGIVVAMPEKGHMEVSLGSDDGLLPGHKLEVYRVGNGESRYLGRIEVVRTNPDRAVCRILPEFNKGQMRTGDRVASKLE